ncbi:hypothetical protein L083_0244 [Actinoplanes sp. N902-109]|nr:hypothetical protein L083_0244 [Actinoplanes sp. N902-109]
MSYGFGMALATVTISGGVTRCVPSARRPSVPVFRSGIAFVLAG